MVESNVGEFDSKWIRVGRESGCLFYFGPEVLQTSESGFDTAGSKITWVLYIREVPLSHSTTKAEQVLTLVVGQGFPHLNLLLNPIQEYIQLSESLGHDRGVQPSVSQFVPANLVARSDAWGKAKEGNLRLYVLSVIGEVIKLFYKSLAVEKV